MERISHIANPESELVFHFGTLVDLRFFPLYRLFRRQLEGLRFLEPVEIGSECQIAEEKPNREAKLPVQRQPGEQRDGSIAR